MPSSLYTRQQFVDENGTPVSESFWWTDKGQAIRWGVFTGIVLLLSLYMILGYVHAKRRLKKGLAPLPYHRWLLSRQQRAIHDPRFNDPIPHYTTYRPQQYGQQYATEMQPPPTYDHTPPPPTYQPPQGGSKVDPSQWRTEPTGRSSENGEPAPKYTAPVGPPPAVLHPNATGSSSTSNSQYRS